MKMTLVDRDEWVSALLSGQFPQMQGFLQSIPKDTEDYHFCCLGVLCALQKPKLALRTYVLFDCMHYEDADTELPEAVTKRFHCESYGLRIDREVLTAEEDLMLRPWDDEQGFPHWAGVKNPDQTVALSVLNDNGFSFARIAELILAHVEIVEDYENGNDTSGPGPLAGSTSLWKVSPGQGKTSFFQE